MKCKKIVQKYIKKLMIIFNVISKIEDKTHMIN